MLFLENFRNPVLNDFDVPILVGLTHPKTTVDDLGVSETVERMFGFYPNEHIQIDHI